MVSNDMTGNISLTSLKSFVGIVLETKSACVEWSSLLGISNPKSNMVYLNYYYRVVDKIFDTFWSNLYNLYSVCLTHIFKHVQAKDGANAGHRPKDSGATNQIG